MKTSRLITGLVSTVLVAATPLALSAPASATETFQAVPALEVQLPYGTDRIAVGESVDVVIEVNYQHPQYGERGVYKGTASLEMFTAKTGTWVNLGPAASNGYHRYEDLKPDSNALFRVAYSGYQATTAYEDTYLAATSEPVAVPVTHRIKDNVGKSRSKKGTLIKGKVTPDYGKKKITILWKKKEKADLKKLRTIKTDKRGKYKVKLPAPRKVGPEYTFVFITKGTDVYSPATRAIVTRKGYFRPVA